MGKSFELAVDNDNGVSILASIIDIDINVIKDQMNFTLNSFFMVDFDLSLDFDIDRGQRDHYKFLVGPLGIEPGLPAWMLAALGLLPLGFADEQDSFWASLLN